MDDEIRLEMSSLIGPARAKKVLGVEGDLFSLSRADTRRLAKALLKVADTWPKIETGVTTTVRLDEQR